MSGIKGGGKGEKEKRRKGEKPGLSSAHGFPARLKAIIAQKILCNDQDLS
jgi:hypothetical protein